MHTKKRRHLGHKRIFLGDFKATYVKIKISKVKISANLSKESRLGSHKDFKNKQL